MECGLDNIVVEIVYNVFGHAQKANLMKNGFTTFSHRFIPIDTDQILGLCGGSWDHIVPILLIDSLAFIPSGGELHFHSIQFSFHEFAMC